MCNGPTYRFSLEVDLVFTTVYPVYDDGLEKVIEKASGEEYYRETLNGSFSFVRDDYDYIDGLSIEKQINFNMEKWDGTEWQTYFSGYFTKTDCRFELDECGDGVCTVDVTPNDHYDKVLGGMDKEFDLIELAPAKTGFNFTRQPIFQVYAVGDTVLTCYLGGTYFELPVETPIFSTSALFSTYYFGYIGSHVVVYGENLDPDISGEYLNDVSLDTMSTNPSYLRKGDGAYRIQVNAGLGWDVVNTTTSTVMYKTADGAALFGDPIVAQVGGHIAYATGRTLFMRFITNQETIFGQPIYDIPASDIVSNPVAYEKVTGVGMLQTDIPYGYGYDNIIIANAGHSATPTRYGKWADDAPYFAGEYFTIPAGLGTGAIYPQGESSRNYGFGDSIPPGSFWFQYDATFRAFQESGAELVQVSDAYKVADAISVILADLNPAVSHSEDSNYSSFLYSSDTALRPTLRYPIITPKTNITVGQYNKPAKKGLIKLADVLQLLWAVYKCKWHIDTSGNFIVEHISYYENGGTYSGTEVSADLTTLIDPQTGRNWEHGANRWEYEKESMPERIEFGWMDRTTREFEGYPIVIRSIYVQKGNIESQKAARFTSDIDYMQLQPEDIAKEGFVIAECTANKGVYTVPYVEITLPDASEYKLQNGYLAFIYLHPNYHRYGLPASLIRLNEEDTTALSITRRKVQEIDYPLLSIADPIKLVTTGLGTGKILELRENVNGEYVTAKIAHDTA
jgi:hypothetical protein